LAAVSYTILSSETDDDKDDFITVKGSDGVLVNCGVERWAIKTCTDGDTTHVNFNIIVPSTISYQRSLPTPPTLPANNRLPLEDSVYQIDCKLVRYKLEDDGDVHCVITANGNLDTMVSEICDPQCPNIAQTSRFAELTTLRNWFVSNYHPSTSWQYPNINIRITGVGFYDFQHGQIGIPPNGREIHPILTMTLLTGIESLGGIIPKDFMLYQNFPNPFNPGTKINFDLPNDAKVNLTVYDMLGRAVAKLIDGETKHAGSYSVNFDGANLSSGVYFYRLQADDKAVIRKMAIIK
jgi:hypothetical protein